VLRSYECRAASQRSAQAVERRIQRVERGDDLSKSTAMNGTVGSSPPTKAQQRCDLSTLLSSDYN
jgi:hypothetical protein